MKSTGSAPRPAAVAKHYRRGIEPEVDRAIER